MLSVFDPLVILSGPGVGFVVGLTGMGGGALMTPILVLLFSVEPLAAVSSDIVASMVMKPIGGAVHFKRGTVKKQLVKWLMLGSVPSAFLGVMCCSSAGHRAGAGVVGQDRARRRAAGGRSPGSSAPLLTRARKPGRQHDPVLVKQLPTLLIGIVGGVDRRAHSVGSGSLMIIIMLLMLYPRMQAVGAGRHRSGAGRAAGRSAALGHILFGDFQLGSDARRSWSARSGRVHRCPALVARPDEPHPAALIIVLLASGSKLLGVSNNILAWVVPIAVAGGTGYALWAWNRARQALARAGGDARRGRPGRDHPCPARACGRRPQRRLTRPRGGSISISDRRRCV